MNQDNKKINDDFDMKDVSDKNINYVKSKNATTVSNDEFVINDLSFEDFKFDAKLEGGNATINTDDSSSKKTSEDNNISNKQASDSKDTNAPSNTNNSNSDTSNDNDMQDVSDEMLENDNQSNHSNNSNEGGSSVENKDDKDKIDKFIQQVDSTNKEYKKMQKLSITLNDVETELKENREKVKILTENNDALNIKVKSLEKKIDKKDTNLILVSNCSCFLQKK